MKRSLLSLTLGVAMTVGFTSDAQAGWGRIRDYYFAPAPATVVTQRIVVPAPAYYAPATTTWYAPAPTATYYAPTTSHYAPYAPSPYYSAPAVYSSPTIVAPAATYSAPTIQYRPAAPMGAYVQPGYVWP